ncbi:MAG: CBS domain-containing protein [Gammaproteobacteria bacterium]
MAYTARDYMSRNFLSFTPDMDVLEAMGAIVEHNISGGPVIDRFGNLVGGLTEIDCLRAAIEAGYHDTRGGKVREYMRPDPVTVDVDDSLMDIARMFRGEADYYRGFPVMKNNRVVGRIGLRQVLRGLQDMSQEDRD